MFIQSMNLYLQSYGTAYSGPCYRADRAIDMHAFVNKGSFAMSLQPSCSFPKVLHRYQHATDRNGRHVSPRVSARCVRPYTFAMARSRPTSPEGNSSGSRRTMMRKTESVQGPIPLIPARAISHGCPCLTLARISSDLCRTVMQHWARRSGRPSARRLSRSGALVDDDVVSIG